RSGILDTEGKLLGAEPKVEGHSDGAEAGRAEHDDEELRVIESEVTDSVALPDPPGGQYRGHPLDAVLQFRIRPGHTVAGQRGSPRIPRRSLREPLGEVHDVGGILHDAVSPVELE